MFHRGGAGRNFFFFFSSRRRHTRLQGDWSSDVCSSDLAVALDLARVGTFEQKVYAVVRSVRWGETTSYGEIAREVGVPHAARAVGQALARNPIPIIIPCHRILAKGHRIGGFSA